MTEDPHQAYIDRLRRHRGPRTPDLSLSFLQDQFKREVEKPHKQLAKLVNLWAQLVPAELAAHTRLESLSRGVLRVAVDSSARLYELDRLLRSGLREQLISGHTGPALRRVRLRVSEGWAREPDADRP